MWVEWIQSANLIFLLFGIIFLFAASFVICMIFKALKRRWMFRWFPLPWSRVKSWECLACGECCKEFDILLGPDEHANIVKIYGEDVTRRVVNKFYLKRRSNGTCLFLYKHNRIWLCKLQHMKPRACKLYPFEVYHSPKFGNSTEAIYRYGDKEFFVYVYPMCMGLRWGKPTPEYAQKTIPEFIEIAEGLQQEQKYSTAKLFSHTQ